MVFVLTYVMTLHYAQNCERMRLGARAMGGGVVRIHTEAHRSVKLGC